jgi:TusA-related sulfurtransferase
MKVLKTLEKGENLEVIADDPGTLKDIPALIKRTGDDLFHIQHSDYEIKFFIEKK